MWGARAVGVAPQAPGHDPLFPKRDGGPRFPKGILLPSVSWGSNFRSSLCPRPVLVYLSVSWTLVSSLDFLHSRWKFLMPVCHTEFKQDDTVHVTAFFFFNLVLFFLKLCPHLVPFYLCSAGLGSLFSGSSRLWELCCSPCYQPCASADLQGEGWRMGKLCLFKNWLLCFKGTEFARTSLAEAAAHALWLGSAASASQPL